MYRLQRTQSFDVTPEVLWRFIQNPANLDDITPPELCFEITSNPPAVMHNGLIIEYRLRLPWFGQRHWLAEIKHVEKQHCFVDEQRAGPYRFWYHYHEIRPAEQATTMLDLVHYQMPYGLLGAVLHKIVVRRTLEYIFDYRAAKLASLFQTAGGTGNR